MDKTKFFYRDKVSVTEGFYTGQVGLVTDYEHDRSEESMMYEVEFTIHNERVWIYEKHLEIEAIPLTIDGSYSSKKYAQDRRNNK